MAYATQKQCVACPTVFRANSNRQCYCSPCKPKIRKEKNKLWQHDYYMKNQNAKLEATREYNKSEKGRAAQQLRDAIRQGKIKRQPCEICREPEAQGHHFDYSKPLEVRWLCPQHHREEHLFEPWKNELRRAGYTEGFLLGQLIETCGKEFDSLRRRSTFFEAVSFSKEQVINTVRGKTPEEAVARLWLPLQKNKALPPKQKTTN